MKCVPFTALRDRAGREAIVERAVGVDGFIDDRSDRPGVARFDGHDRRRGEEVGGCLDVSGLPEVGVDAGVLEYVRGLLEGRLVGGGAVEVELRLLDRGLPSAFFRNATCARRSSWVVTFRKVRSWGR